jgi:hypothetical protein
MELIEKRKLYLIQYIVRMLLIILKEILWKEKELNDRENK